MLNWGAGEGNALPTSLSVVHPIGLASHWNGKKLVNHENGSTEQTSMSPIIPFD